jgi:hypothetical protein
MTPVVRHASCIIDQAYKFNMSRFLVLDHFNLSGMMYGECILRAFVLHEIDNLSDHDPIILELKLFLSS